MKRKLTLITFVLLAASSLLLGMDEAADVVAYRYLQQGEITKALEIYLQNNNYSGAGMAYCSLRLYEEAISSFEKSNDH